MRINIQTQKKRQSFSLLFGILMMLIFVRYVLQVSFHWGILLLVVALIALTGDRDEIIAMCLCCTPLYTSMQYLYAVVICLAFYILKYGKEMRVDSGISLVMLMLVWEWLHSLNDYSSVIGAVRALVPVILCAFLMFCPKGRINYAFAARVFALCVALMCVVVLSKLLVNSGFNVQSAFSNMQRLGMDEAEEGVLGADFNPNFLGFICLIGATSMIQLHIAKQGRKLDMVIAILLLLCGTLTLSRTYLVCLALMAVLLVLASGYDFVKLVKLTGAIIGICLLVVLLVFLFFPDTVEDWVGRFQVEDITSGRLILIARFNERIFENPDIYLFGMGIQRVTDKVVARFGPKKILGTVVPHNSIQEMILCWGIPGLLLFIAFLISMVSSAKRKNPDIKLLNYIPLILLLVKSQAGQLITTPANLLLLSLTYLSMCHSFNKSEEHMQTQTEGVNCNNE